MDVAEDFTLFVPTKVRPEDTQPERGAFFVTEGRIFPAGTIPSGGTPEAPGPSIRTAPARSGSGSAAAPTSSRRALPDDGERGAHQPDVPAPERTKSLTTDGLEGAGAATVRAVTGGTGPFTGYVGEQRQELIGFNARAESTSA